MLRHPAFSGIPNANRGEQKISGGPKQRGTRSEVAHPCLIGGPKEGRLAMPPLHSPGSPTPSVGTKIRRGETKSEVATSPLPSRGPQRRQKCYATPAFLRIHNAKRGEQKVSGGPKQRGKKSVVPTSPMPPQGPKRGRRCYATPAFSGIPNAKRGEQKISSSPKQRGTKSDLGASPLPSRGPKRGWKCYVTRAFSRIPNTTRRQQKMRSGPQQKGTKSEAVAFPLPSPWSKKRA